MPTTPHSALADLSAAGVSIWLDDLSRQRIESGNVTQLIQEDEVVGVSSNPTIFAGPAHVGIDLDDVFLTLEDEGVASSPTPGPRSPRPSPSSSPPGGRGRTPITGEPADGPRGEPP